MLNFQILGRIDISGGSDGGTDPSGLLSQPKPTALLVYLALARPGTLKRRDALAAMLWPESDQKRARAALSQTLYVIRKHLGSDVVITRGTEDVGVVNGGIRIDALEFHHLLEGGEREQALGLYGGELLPSFYLPDTPSFEHWLDTERSRLRRSAATAAWQLAEEYEGKGNQERSSNWARRAVSIDPHDEAALRQLMETLSRLGDRTGALAEYHRYRKRLWGEMELEPESDTSALAAEIDAEGKRGEGPQVQAPLTVAPEPAEERAVEADVGAGAARPSTRRRWAGATVAFVLIVGGYAVLSRVMWPPSPDVARGETVPSLAVLPIGAEPQLSEQITRRLIETLQVAGLRTQGWLSVRSVDAAGEAQAIGDRLGVDYLIEGSATRSEDRLDLAVSLVDAADGFVVWSENFTGSPRDLRDMEVQVAQAVIDQVAGRQGRDPRGFQIKRYTQSPVADSLYRWGVYLGNHSYNAVTMRRAAEAFRAAIAADSSFAPAYIGLADALFQQSRVYWDPEPREAVPAALELLLRAQQLDPSLADTYTSQGWYYYGYARDYDRALASHERAIQLAPGEALAYTGYAFPLVATGLPDSALAVARRARDLEPLNPMVVSTQCWIQYLADRLGEAHATCKFVTDSIDATFKVAVDIQELTSYLLMARAGDSDGLAASRRALEASPPPAKESYFEIGPSWYWAIVGDTARALAIVEEEKIRPHVRPLRIATGYAAAGQLDSAYAWLDQAIEARDPYVPEIAMRPEMEPFRKDPRFPEYLQKLGLGPYFTGTPLESAAAGGD